LAVLPNLFAITNFDHQALGILAAFVVTGANKIKSDNGHFKALAKMAAAKNETLKMGRLRR